MERPTEQTVRTGNRERQRLHRKRQKQKRARALEVQRLASERAERMRRGPHFFGETSPGWNANTFVDELQIHREFLRALGKEDVQDGETLRTVAKRAFEAWLTGPFTCRSCGPPFYVPAFNRVRQQFDADFGFGIGDVLFEDIWTSPKDCPRRRAYRRRSFTEAAEAIESETRKAGTHSRTSITSTVSTGTDSAIATQRDQLRVDSTERATIFTRRLNSTAA